MILMFINLSENIYIVDLSVCFMKKSVLVLSLLLVCSVLVNAEGMTHSASEICVDLGGGKAISLQNAIDGNYFNSGVDWPTSGSCSGAHYANDILIKNFDNNVMTLQEAVTNNRIKSGLSMTTSLPKGHLNADEIIVSVGGVEKSLQSLISDSQICKPLTCGEMGKSCSLAGSDGYDDGCGGTLNCGSCPSGTSCNSNGVCEGPSCGIDYNNPCGSNYVVTGGTSFICYPAELCMSSYSGHWDTCTNTCSGLVYVAAGTDVTRKYFDNVWNFGNSNCNLNSECSINSRTCSGNSIVYHETCKTLKCNGYSMTPMISTYSHTSYYDCTVLGSKYTCDSDTTSCKEKPSVICTEMNRLGYMDDETYKIDREYAENNISYDAMKGYRAWGIPVVKSMRKHPESLSVVAPMVKSFTQEIKYRAGKSDVGDEIGALYLDEAVPLFERIGVLIEDPYLYNEDLFSDKSLIYRVIKFAKGLFVSENKNPNNVIVENYFSEEKLANMFYGSLGNKTEPDMEFNEAFLKELEKSVEEIEELVGK